MIAFESLLPLRLEEFLGSQQAAGADDGSGRRCGLGDLLARHLPGRRRVQALGVARAAMLGRLLNGDRASSSWAWPSARPA
jgi:hypothetical protein